MGGFSFERNAGLCAPTNAAFQNWLRGIPRRTGPNCAPPSAPPAAAPPTLNDELLDRYDTDGSGSIEIDEVVQAVNDYADGNLTIEEVVIVVRLYASG